MKKTLQATGIIVEYNPFHNGHFYHIQKAKAITPDAVIIAVMSPHFVQRGEPAFVNKWERTKAALEHGVDLVVELPTVYAIQSADYFAKASVEILALMKVSSIVFGSETADADAINAMAPNSSDPTRSFASNPEVAKNSNDILGSQYVLNAKRYGINTHAIKRTNSYHDSDVNNSISSASAIRKNFKINPVSHTTPMDLSKLVTHTLEDYESLIKMSLYTESSELSQRLLVNEGIENLLVKHRKLPLQDLIDTCTNKKYTRSRIQRTLMAFLLSINKESVQEIKQVRVLGMNGRGKQYLANLRDMEVSPVVSFKNYHYKDLEIKATGIYALPKEQDYQDYLNQAEIETIIIVD